MGVGAAINAGLKYVSGEFLLWQDSDDYLEANALENYKKHLSSELPLEEQNISEKTISYLGVICLNYWCDTKEEKQDFLYRIDERGVVIEGYIGRKKNLVIPENIDDRPVYKIDDNAFYEDEKLKKITLPDTLRIIGKESFACSTLKTPPISLPKSRLSISIIE